MLAGVVMVGTGKAAQIGEFAAGKTGTTENYGCLLYTSPSPRDRS